MYKKKTNMQCKISGVKKLCKMCCVKKRGVKYAMFKNVMCKICGLKKT